MTLHLHRARRRSTALLACGLALSLVTAGCGGTKSGDKDPVAGDESPLVADKLTADDGESGLADAGEPVRGGTLLYGVEGETSAGYCLAEGQLAISGIMVARTIFDTLTVPNAEGDFVPYLAKSITPNDDFTEWSIGLREGITFHDGSPLTAEVVKNNLDAYRGTYEGRSPLLFSFVLKNIEDVSVVDPLTVKVTTTVPWVAFPSYLYNSGRVGIMAQAQLDDDTSCATKPIGTGPFVFKSWVRNDKLVAERNPDYWQIAPDGEAYPYADRVEFRIMTDSQVRKQAVESGSVNIIHSSTTEQLPAWAAARDKGDVNLYVSQAAGEVTFIQLNNTKPPFDDPRMRKALAMSLDREDLNQFQQDGYANLADGPIAEGQVGYVENPGYPEYDLEGAKKLVAEYEAEGGDASFTMTSGADPSVTRLVQTVQQRVQKAGMDMNILNRDQAAGINDAIAKNYQASVFRNYPGGDPDGLYVWFYGGTTAEDGTFSPNLVNFAGFNDDVVNSSLDEGRSEPDPAKRASLYEALFTQTSKEVFNIWLWYTSWAIITQPDVHNVLGPPLPGDDPSTPGEASTDDPARQPSQGLATGHSMLGLWVE